jgi:hypothetical protein
MAESEKRHDYEVARFSGWLSVLPHVKKEKAPADPEKLIKFKWEKTGSDTEDFINLKDIDVRELIMETFKPKKNGKRKANKDSILP